VRWKDDGIDDVNLVFTVAGGERFEIAGTFAWRGEAVEIAHTTIAPDLLLAGKPAPFTFNMTGPGSRVALTGELQAGPDPRVAGTGTIELRSPRDFSRWSGFDLPLAPTLQRMAVAGEFSTRGRLVTWPSVVLSVGQDRLEGSLSMRLDGRRAVVTGTLAANRIDLTEFFGPFLQARTPAGLWSGEDVSLTAATGGDLDLRLSAADATIGRIRLADMAAGILIRPGRIEASLGRAGLNGGSVKGRLVFSESAESADLKVQGAFEQVDLAAFLADVGQPRWITGQAQGQVALETSGATIADLVRQAHGRTAITVRQGELVGIGLVDALKRVEKRPLAASTEWKGGRTFFDQAHVTLNVGAGVGEITEGAMTAANLRTGLQGRVSLIERSVTIRALVDPAAPSAMPSPLIVLDVLGGWDDVAIVPDVKSLIERSRAAKPLLEERIAPRGPPVAAAQ
jgi:AsmA protein